MAVDQETAIQKFLDFSKRLQADPDLTAEKALNQMVEFYTDVRIEGAELDDDGYMLLLQWGAIRPLLVDQPVDLRKSPDDVDFDDTEYTYLDITRQVLAVGDDGDPDFDESAVQLSISLFYEAPEGKVKGANLWISQPDDLTKSLAEFKAVPFVSQHLGAKISRMTATVGHCG